MLKASIININSFKTLLILVTPADSTTLERVKTSEPTRRIWRVGMVQCFCCQFQWITAVGSVSSQMLWFQSGEQMVTLHGVPESCWRFRNQAKAAKLTSRCFCDCQADYLHHTREEKRPARTRTSGVCELNHLSHSSRNISHLWKLLRKIKKVIATFPSQFWWKHQCRCEFVLL